MNRFLNIIRNKYLIVASAFVVWMLFFDRNDLMQQYEYRTQLNSLQEEKAFYTKEIAQVKTDLTELTTNRDKLEKFAREKYHMKKANEDVYVIVKEAKKEKKSIF
jgi:cell division protein FtsB